MHLDMFGQPLEVGDYVVGIYWQSLDVLEVLDSDPDKVTIKVKQYKTKRPRPRRIYPNEVIKITEEQLTYKLLMDSKE